MAGDEPSKRIQDALAALTMGDDAHSRPKKKYEFWETQPVAQFGEEPSSSSAGDGPIDAPKTPEQVRQEPYPLPSSFEWCTCNVNNEEELKEIYSLLSNHYVEDDDNMFRFAYSKEFLEWALKSPGYKQEWHCGVRAAASRKLVAFISGIPATLRVRQASVSLVEINFLCVHKRLRSKRLAPVLIKEITRRVNLFNIWQAVYTAGVVLPKPVAECQYWHRSLNPRKLIAVGFSRLSQRMTMARTLKLYKLPEAPQTPGVREMRAGDVPQVTRLLLQYLEKYQLAPVLSEEEVSHWLCMRPDVVYTYVVEGTGGRITDFFSFYTLPSTVIGHDTYNSLKAAYMFYTVAAATPLPQLMNDALIQAHATGHDVFNALDIFQNDEALLKDLKFGIGDGKLRYYLYNWRVARELQPSEVGLVML